MGRSSNGREPAFGRKALIGLAVIVLAAAAVFIAVVVLQNQSLRAETRADYDAYHGSDDVIMEWDGQRYRQRRDLTVILLAGVDRDDSGTGFRSGGQADFERVVVIDAKNRTVDQIAIDRDTMTEVTTLSMLGKRTGTRTMQICLAHALGNGGTFSAELQVEAVSRFLLDVPVTEYATMTMSGIAVLNDLVGGITVTLTEDMTYIDPSMKAGAEVTLLGTDAEQFIRARMRVGGGTNAERMGRQESYLSALLATAREKMSESRSFISRVYDELEPYLVTNISKGRLVNEAWAARDYAWHDPVTIDGTHTVGEDGFMEFHADEDSVRRVVLDLFYEPLDK